MKDLKWWWCQRSNIDLKLPVNSPNAVDLLTDKKPNFRCWWAAAWLSYEPPVLSRMPTFCGFRSLCVTTGRRTAGAIQRDRRRKRKEAWMEETQKGRGREAQRESMQTGFKNKGQTHLWRLCEATDVLIFVQLKVFSGYLCNVTVAGWIKEAQYAVICWLYLMVTSDTRASTMLHPEEERRHTR